MQSRKYYEAYWSQYDDVVTLNEFRNSRRHTHDYEIPHL